MSTRSVEWVGGHLPEPMSHVILWFDTSRWRFIGFYRRGDHDLGSSVLAALAERRPPDRIRLTNRRDAERVRTALVGQTIEVVVAPIPEFEEVFDLVVDMAVAAGSAR